MSQSPALLLLPLLLAAAAARSAAAHDGLDGRIAAVDARLEQRPGDAALLLERAEYRRMQRQWRAALADLAAAARADPRLAAVPLSKARLFVDAKQGERALAALAEFAAIGGATTPGADEAALLRARALAQLGRGEEAALAFDRAIELATRPRPDLYFERALHAESLGGPWRERAVAGLDEGIARIGGAMQLEELALRLESEHAEWDAALRRIDRLRRASPRPELWDAREAAVLERAGRVDEARATVDRALARLAAAPARVRALAASKQLENELKSRRAGLEGNRGAGKELEWRGTAPRTAGS